MQQAILIFDGSCGFCRSSIDWIRNRDSEGRFEYFPLQDDSFGRRFPGLTREECMRALHLVLEDGSVRVGADALPMVLERLTSWRRLAPLLGHPLLRSINRWMYRQVARRRARDDGAASCEFRT